MANRDPIRFDLLPRIPAEAAFDERRGTLRFVVDREYPVVADRAGGFVEKIAVDGGAVKLTGWVVDKAYNVPPPVLFATAGAGRVLDTTTKFSPRSDVAQHLGASVDEFGFQLGFTLHAPAEEAVSLWLMLQNMEVTHFLTLQPGEVATTGTPRGGAGD